ncbi:MAG: metallophosphoesterase [Butyrivibrio sp.]|nr:metallophosphoesterase [Acetatifactor muris]MCM1560476.1 metallophosphoesterase [Butyrivibrio sp.]
MTDVIITILVILCIFIMWVMLYDSNRFVVRRLELSDRRIKKPVRAVVLADLHNKCYGKGNRMLLEAIREQKPDMILIAGDILTARPGKSPEPAIHFLCELSKEFPVYYGNGNHEYRLKLYPQIYGSMAEEYGQALADMGIHPLVNSHVKLEDSGIKVYGAEIEKHYYKRFTRSRMEKEYLDQLLGIPDNGRYTVLLAHNPDYFPQYARWGADLTVSGHVHGGVIRVPLLGRGVISPGLRLFPKYDGGIFKEDEAVMLLSRGLGMHTIPVRLFNPGELWVVDFGPEKPRES